jgi:hypothetical protein
MKIINFLEWLNEWLFFNAKLAIFKPYHEDEKKIWWQDAICFVLDLHTDFL